VVECTPFALLGALALLGLCVLWTFIKLLVPRARLRDARDKVVPGPPASLIGGNLKDLARMIGKHGQQLFRYMMEHDAELVGIQLPSSKAMVMICSVEGFRTLLSGSHAKFPKDAKYECLECVLGKGLVTSNGDLWKAHRTLINPAFHAESLSSMFPSFVGHTQELIDILIDKISSLPPEDLGLGFSTDFLILMSELTGDIICDTAFGYQLNSKRHDSSSLFGLVADCMEETRQRFRDPFSFVRYLPTKRNHRFRKAKAQIDALVGSILAARHEESTGQRERRLSEPKRVPDLLDHLMSARDEWGERLPDQMLIDQCMTFLGAGHETTANALTWIMYELGRNPDIMQKLQSEVDRVLRGRAPTFDTIAKLEYLNLVLKESLRLHPPVAVIGRDITEDLEVSGYLFSPKDVFVALNIFGMHRHPKVWNEPLKFLPERFDLKSPHYRKMDPFAYVPFSSGPRSCIGQRFAALESVVILAMLLQRFDIQLQSLAEREGVENITMRIKDGLPVWFRLRSSS